MSEDVYGMVRRSSRNEIFERVKRDGFHNQNKSYFIACQALSLDPVEYQELGESAPEFAKCNQSVEELIERFGPLRPVGDLVYKDVGGFVEALKNAYTDSRRVAGFQGIELIGQAKKVSSSSVRDLYEFSTGILESIGDQEDSGIYQTLWKFRYQRDRDDEDPLETDVEANMLNLQSSLETALSEEFIDISVSGANLSMTPIK